MSDLHKLHLHLHLSTRSYHRPIPTIRRSAATADARAPPVRTRPQPGCTTSGQSGGSACQVPCRLGARPQGVRRPGSWTYQTWYDETIHCRPSVPVGCAGRLFVVHLGLSLWFRMGLRRVGVVRACGLLRAVCCVRFGAWVRAWVSGCVGACVRGCVRG